MDTHLTHPRRRVAVDTVHVRDPARGVDRDSRRPVRGRRPRRREAAAIVLFRDAAPARADRADRGDVPAHRRGQAVRHHPRSRAAGPAPTPTRPRTTSTSRGSSSSTSARAPPAPDVHGDPDVHLLLARATAAEAGGGRRGRRGSPRRRARPLACRSSAAARSGSAPSRARSSSCSISASCSCRSTGPRSRRSSRRNLLADPPIWWPSDPTRLHYDCAGQLQRVEGPQELAHRRPPWRQP